MLCRCALVSKVDVLGGLKINENLIRDLLLFDSNLATQNFVRIKHLLLAQHDKPVNQGCNNSNNCNLNKNNDNNNNIYKNKMIN